MDKSFHRACPLCAKNDASLFLQKEDLRLVRCQNCSMIYADPVPPEMASGAFYNAAAESYYLSAAKLQSDYSPVRFERELKIFRRFCKSGRVLDVGCSTGAFLYQLKQRFGDAYSVVGTDISGAPLDFAEQKGVPVLRGNFLQEKLGENSFDAITFWAVMEHLAEPSAFLDKAKSLLKPAGFCFILVPNMDSLAVRSLGKKYRYIYPQHVNYFSRNTLSQFAGAEFEMLLLTSTHFNPLVILKDFRSSHTLASNSERAQLLQRTTAYKQNPWLAPVKLAYQAMEKILSPLFLCDNLVMVLRKK